MYIWKISRLKEDIKSDSLTEQDRFIYALVYVALSALCFEAMSFIPVESSNIWDYIYSIGSVLIVIIGTILAFKANGGSHGADFLGRYLSIGFVVAVRFMVILLPLLIALSIYYDYAFSIDEEIVSTPAEIIIFLIWNTAVYWRLYKHMQEVKNA